MKEHNKNIVLELQFPNNSENISNLNASLTHLLDLASSFHNEDPINSNDGFWLSQLLQATMKASWSASDRDDPIVCKPQPVKGAS